MSIELCAPSLQPFSSGFTAGAAAFSIVENQTCLLTFEATIASTMFVGFLLRISQQMATLPSFQLDVYNGNSGPGSGPLINTFNLGENDDHIDMAASFGNISVVFTTGPEPLGSGMRTFAFTVDTIRNYTTETINFENVDNQTQALLIPNVIEIFSYSEILIIGCPECLIRYTAEDPSITLVFDGPLLTSPRLGQFVSGTDTPGTTFTSTGNMLLLQIANADFVNPGRIVNAGTITEILNNITIVCTSAETRVYLDEMLLNDLQVQPNDDTVASAVQVSSTNDVQPMCVPVRQMSTLHFYRFGISDCGTLVQANETHETFSYLFWKIPNDQENVVLQRFSDACLNLSCTYEVEQNVTSDSVSPDPIKVELMLEAQDANFEFEYKFYSNDSFVDPVPANQYFVRVPDFVYFSLEIQNNLNIEACTCWATPDAVLTNPIQYIILEESCPIGEMFDGSPAVEIFRNGNDSIVRAAFRSYRWNRMVKRHEFINGTGPPSPIFLHCSVRICDDEQNALFCDGVTCPMRKKRTVDNRKSQIMSSKGIFIDSYQEQRIMEDACKENNGECKEGCVTDYNGNPLCYCYHGKILQPDGSCANQPNHELNKQEDQTITDYLSTDMIIITLLVCALIFAFIRNCTKKRENVTYTDL